MKSQSKQLRRSNKAAIKKKINNKEAENETYARTHQGGDGDGGDGGGDGGCWGR